jgi:hypothetical protein
MDEADKTPLATLDDGVEVRILAWRPGWAGTTRYRVRAILSGLDGWLVEHHLRSSEAFVPVVAAAPTVEAFAHSARAFGASVHRR